MVCNVFIDCFRPLQTSEDFFLQFVILFSLIKAFCRNIVVLMLFFSTLYSSGSLFVISLLSFFYLRLRTQAPNAYIRLYLYRKSKFTICKKNVRCNIIKLFFFWCIIFREDHTCSSLDIQ